eukprot:scaffold101155_cov27-Phaeocystis_antarctica.AAC.1
MPASTATAAAATAAAAAATAAPDAATAAAPAAAAADTGADADVEADAAPQHSERAAGTTRRLPCGAYELRVVVHNASGVR